MNTTGGVQGSGGGGTLLSRVDAIEAELRRLTGLTEELQIRIDRVVSDGTKPEIGDLEFRLCELEDGLQFSAPWVWRNAQPRRRRGAMQGAGSFAPSRRPSRAVPTWRFASNQGDFDRARAALRERRLRQLRRSCSETFTMTYPEGPMSAEAHYLRGQSRRSRARGGRRGAALSECLQPPTPKEHARTAALFAMGSALAERARPTRPA